MTIRIAYRLPHTVISPPFDSELIHSQKTYNPNFLAQDGSLIGSMVKRANPLILEALIEDIHVLSSKRMMKLKEDMRRRFVRIGGV